MSLKELGKNSFRHFLYLGNIFMITIDYMNVIDTQVGYNSGKKALMTKEGTSDRKGWFKNP
jgi:hypothetical protein